MERENKFAGSRKKTHEPRILGEILGEFFASNENPVVTYRKRALKKQGWHRNTELGVDLKTILRTDSYARTGKTYPGVLRRDADAEVEEYRSYDPHYTFVETERPGADKRNPHVFRGQYITLTRREDGTLRLNFRPLPADLRACDLEQYALAVYNEICIALGGLIER